MHEVNEPATRPDAPLILTAIHLDNERTVDGLVKEIHPQGLQIWVPEFIQPNNRVNLVFQNNGRQFAMTGSCIYCLPLARDNDEIFMIGVSFQDFDKNAFELRAADFDMVCCS